MTNNGDAPTGAGERNRQLREFYQAAYAKGADVAFSNWSATEADAVVASSIDWSGKRVLDVGCGVGRLSRLLRDAGANSVVGIDYAEEAIQQANAQNEDASIAFHCVDVFDFAPDASFDAVVTLGTMEHMDDPERFLAHISGCLSPTGRIVVTCPHFLNIRGFIWMALSGLFEVPMSLSDLHFIHPWDMARWASGVGMKVASLSSMDESRGSGERLIEDFEKRLPNALRDAGFDTGNVDRFMSYLREAVTFADTDDRLSFHGATALYVLEREAAA